MVREEDAEQACARESIAPGPSKHKWNWKLGRVRCLLRVFKSLTSLIQVRDEVLYHAKLHPEQYSDTFSSAQLKQLHTSIIYVCKTAVDLLADSSKFPDEWLFKHRWGKGKKDSPTSLPNGAKITFLTVGGRTSCVVPSVQKKTGAVAGDITAKGEEAQNANIKKNTGEGESKKRKDPAEQQVENDTVGVKVERNGGQGRKRKKSRAETGGGVEVNGFDEQRAGTKAKAKKSKADAPSTSAKASSKLSTADIPSLGRRRSSRVSRPSP